jgi:NAD-dependent DNA ligase
VPKLYTRGNGVEGQDISHLIPYLRLPLKDKCTLRGELILSKRIFQEKYNKKAANARNLVSGWVNRKIASPELWCDLSFVAYEMVYPQITPIDQKKRLTKMNVECVKCYQTNGLDNTILSKLLVELRDKYMYEIDGIIVRENKYVNPQTTNPKNAFAFKMILADQVVETKVLEVEWNASKNGYLKPTIKVETCSIGGVTIQRATGFNGKFIQDHGIGPGAVVLLIRSGDVIPHISKVLQSVAPQLPANPYNWTSTGVDMVLQNASNDSQVIGKQLLAFFQGMDVEGIGPGIISRFVDNGYDTIEKILAMSVEDIKELEGFQEKSAKKVYTSIHQQIKSVSLARLLGKTTIFGRGFGEKRIQSILDVYPAIFVEIETKPVLLEKICNIPGFSSKTAGAFVDNIHRVQGFLDTLHRSYSETSPSGNAVVAQTHSHELSGKKVVFSGVRNKSLVEKMTEYAIQVVDQVTKDTALLIVKDKTDITSKIEKANKYNVPIVTIEEFHL